MSSNAAEVRRFLRERRKLLRMAYRGEGGYSMDSETRSQYEGVQARARETRRAAKRSQADGQG